VKRNDVVTASVRNIREKRFSTAGALITLTRCPETGAHRSTSTPHVAWLAGDEHPNPFETDRETLQHALASLASINPDRLRIVRITDTLNLERLLVSEPCLDAMRMDSNVTITGAAKPMRLSACCSSCP
jgi:hypothetical protein